MEHIYKNIKPHFKLDEYINTNFKVDKKNGIDFILDKQNDLDAIKKAIIACRGNEELYKKIKEIYDKIEYKKLSRATGDANPFYLDSLKLIFKDFKPFELE